MGRGCLQGLVHRKGKKEGERGRDRERERKRRGCEEGVALYRREKGIVVVERGGGRWKEKSAGW